MVLPTAPAMATGSEAATTRVATNISISPGCNTSTTTKWIPEDSFQEEARLGDSSLEEVRFPAEVLPAPGPDRKDRAPKAVLEKATVKGTAMETETGKGTQRGSASATVRRRTGSLRGHGPFALRDCRDRRPSAGSLRDNDRHFFQCR